MYTGAPLMKKAPPKRDADYYLEVIGVPCYGGWRAGRGYPAHFLLEIFLF